MFAVGYGLARISLETVREPDAYLPHFPFGLTMGMMLSGPMVLIGLFFIWRGLREPIVPQAPTAAAKAVAADEPA